MPASTSLERLFKQFMEQIVARWSKDFSKIHKRLDDIQPNSKLPPIPSVKPGEAGFKREVNVAQVLRDVIEKANAVIPEGQEKYIQFPEGFSDKKLNSDAKDALEILMLQLIGEDYGRLSWKTASRSTHMEQCESVIRAAAASPDFMVFRQTSFFWAIRELADQKMKSKGRVAAQLRQNEVQENEGPSWKRMRLEKAPETSRTTTALDASIVNREVLGRPSGTQRPIAGRGRGRGARGARGSSRGRSLV